MTIKKDIIYPIFLECSQFITDKFWENIFEDLPKSEEERKNLFPKCPKLDQNRIIESIKL